MSTRVRNITGSPVTLPFPYRGILGPGLGTILTDNPAIFLIKIGGAFQIASVLDIGPTDEVGVPANDPSPGAEVPTYDNATLPVLPSGDMPPGTEVFNTDMNGGVGQPIWVSADGTFYVTADGNPT